MKKLLGPFFPLVMAMAVVVVIVAVGIGFRALFVTSADQAAVDAAPRISDTAWEQGAVGVCRQYVRVFDTETTLGKQPSSAAVGSFLDSIATSFDQMVGRLRAVPVTVAADGPAIAAWLGQWDQYDAFGHRYAAAVRAGAERDLVAQNTRSIDELRRRRNGFARANHLGTCAFN